MKRINRIISLMLSFLMITSLSSSSIVSAYTRDTHDKYMCDVLFKSYKNVDIDNNAKTQEKIKALSCASYLSIDQYNGHGNEDLIFLEQFGVHGLPDSINEIDYTGGSYHRKSTHRGWSAETTGVYNASDTSRWIIRKKILLNTAQKIFDFKGNTSKMDSFCALVYYIHILGDRMADEKYYPNYVIMELGGRNDKQDITHELIHHISILFADQKSTNKYEHVISKLELYNRQISKLMKDNNNKLSEEDFILYNKYAYKIMELLIYNLPEMLKEEDFFREAFY